MTQKEFDWLQRLEKNVDAHWDELTGWEQRFTEDLLERFRHWGIHTNVSPKEWRVLTEISNKIIP